MGPPSHHHPANRLACPPLGSNELPRGARCGAHRVYARCLILPASRHSTGTLRSPGLLEDDKRVSRGGQRGGREHAVDGG
ncbi:hypothetical protein CGRA01v4_09434 [Colletotrichum graminicola]|nr:hypothetical protein CGRA01v4_09434 [Colletotrichum graminicola]